jgi:acetyl-CoA carboxylase biotin carboxyl carrier protein
MRLTDADVQEIIRLLDGSDYDALEIETERFRLVLQRGGTGQTGWSQQRQTLARPHVVGAPAAAGARAGREGTTDDREVAAGTDDGLTAIRSPIVGTFYRAPRPGADPFVQPGSRVGPDTVVAIIEVMKLMNSLSAGVDGEIVDILVEDGHLVEKGQRLMRVRPLPAAGQSG